MANLHIENVIKSYGAINAVDGFSLHVEGAELIALLGPSGCGKTTLLRMIAGFIPVTEGRISIDGRDVTTEPPDRRNTGMVFQNYALFPHMTVEKNVAFGLEMRKVPADEIQRRVREALGLVHLERYGERLPRELSGGQQQRVALARALVINPDIFLLDEPLSNLDAKLRQKVGLEIRDLQQRLGLTTVFVTHDQNEALMMADRVVVMRDGRIVQAGSAAELYNRPVSRFVAEFLGQSNILFGSRAPNGFITEKGLKLCCNSDGKTQSPDEVVAFRPENVVLGPGASHLANCFEGEVQQVTYLGSTSVIKVRLQSGETIVAHRQNREGESLPLTPGEPVITGWHSDVCQFLPNDVSS